MKVQFIFNKVKNKSLAHLGIAEYKTELEKLGYTVDLSFKDTELTFQTYQFSSDVVGNATSIKEQDLVPLMESGNRLTIAILGSDSSNPRHSNPVQYPINKNGNTLIVIPEHWYGEHAFVLCDYLLHETAHAGFFFAMKPDRVHTLPDKYASTVNAWRVYYIELLKELKPFLETIIESTQSEPILKKGSKRNSVRLLQRLLGIKEDGHFGPMTEKAVKEFQFNNKLKADGIVGPKTWASLKKKPKLDLVDALLIVESNNNDNAIGDKGLKYPAYGALQIRQPLVDDVNRRFKTSYKSQECLGNRNLSLWLFEKYFEIYNHNKTDEQKARAWNGGGNWNKIYGKKGYENYSKNLDIYWNKIKKHLAQ